MNEFELKFLDIKEDDLIKNLISIGAVKKQEFLYRRAVFDYPDLRLEKDHGWIRLRTDGENTTLAFKQRVGVKPGNDIVSDDGMREIEISVSSYQDAYEFLVSIGFVVKREQENKRIRYTKGNTVFDIDSWPQIPTYLEVEANSLEDVRNSAVELGLNPDEGFMFSAKQVYEYYGINESDYSKMFFSGFIKKKN